MAQSKTASQNEGWEIVSSEMHYQNDHVAVATETIRTPTRIALREWTVVHRKRAVVIAPVTVDGKFILIRQERIPIRKTIWEVPGGQIDEASAQDPIAISTIALRELLEETGFELAPGGELIPLGDYFTSPGFTNEHGYFFLARPVRLSPDGHAHDESEAILDCRAFSAREVLEMIDHNQICDANTLSICSRLMARGILHY